MGWVPDGLGRLWVPDGLDDEIYRLSKSLATVAAGLAMGGHYYPRNAGGIPHRHQRLGRPMGGRMMN